MRLVSLLALLPVVLSAQAARASGGDPPLGAPALRQDLDRYFTAEKTQAVLFLGLGLLSLVAGGVLVTKEGFSRGTAFPLLGAGLVTAAIGGRVLLRTDGQLAELDARLASDPAGLRASELARIRGINRSFRLVEAAEVAAIAAGLAMLTLATTPDRSLVRGIGLGLLLEGALLWPMDMIAHGRSRGYTESLLRFQPGAAAVSPGGTSAAGPPRPPAGQEAWIVRPAGAHVGLRLEQRGLVRAAGHPREP
jgi:hypothetical protein